MPLYQYQAFDQAGVLRKGSEDAVSESDLRQRLRSQQLYPKEIRFSQHQSFLPPKTWNQLQASVDSLHSTVRGVDGRYNSLRQGPTTHH